MEFKGTKGKWYVSQPNGKSICAETDNPLGYEVVVVQDGFMSKYDQKAKANALLASKAPEMFEMLSHISCNTDQICNDSGMGYIIDYDDMDRLRALIKEATEL